MTEKSELTLDYDRIWAALSRSTQARDALEKVAQEVLKTAQTIAQIEVYDKGKYRQGLKVLTVPVRVIKAELRKRQRTRGTRFDNPLLSAKFKGDPDGGAYDGTVALVSAFNWKSSIIEFGSLARNPSLVLTRAAEKAASPKVRWTVLFEGTLKKQNLAEFGRKIAETKKKKKDRKAKAQAGTT